MVKRYTTCNILEAFARNIIGSVVIFGSVIYRVTESMGENPNYWNISYAGLVFIGGNQLRRGMDIFLSRRKPDVDLES